MSSPQDSRIGATRSSTAGIGVYPEVAKTGLIDLSLACSFATLYGFTGFGVV